MIYVNEIDPYCAQWLQNLMDAGVLPPGHIDTRSIEDVTPNDLAGYTQCHFFAGLGGWIYALDLAGWPRDRPVWTGSCPCQPFSAAGKGAGFADERHLWPAWQHLIAQRKPATVFGEQVASKAVDDWIDLVHADMEAMGYAFGLAAFPAASVGAPHIRDRAFWVGHRLSARLEGHGRDGGGEARWSQQAGSVAETGGACGMADSQSQRWNRGKDSAESSGRNGAEVCGHIGGLADTELQQRPSRETGVGIEHDATGRIEGAAAITGLRGDLRTGPTSGFWRNADWLRCTDGKWRPVEPGTFPLAHGAPSRVGRLRAYGNAIVAESAITFIESVMTC